MKGILIALILILSISATIFLYDGNDDTPSFLPLTTNISWNSQSKTLLDNNEKNSVMTMLETIQTYEQNIYAREQTLTLDVLEENLFLDVSSTRYTVFKQSASFESYQTQRIVTDGYELILDTGGITGELSASVLNYETRDTAYFSTELILSNPPFNISANEYQQMPASDATLQFTNLFNLNLEIDPLTIIPTIDFESDTTSFYKLEHGYYIEAQAILVDGLILGITSVPATVQMVVYEGYLMTFHIEVESEALSIPNTFIDNGEDTLEIILSLDASYDYDIWEQEVSVPDENDLRDYEVVDTFSLPDVTSIFNP